MKFKRVCDAAVWWLRKTNNPAVGWGDSYLLHEIAKLMGWAPNSWRTEKRVLNALTKTPGDMVPAFVRYHRRVRNFWLPERCPNHLKNKSIDSQV